MGVLPRNPVKRVSIVPGQYLVFAAEGEMPGVVIEAWKAVWDYFSTNPKYERAFSTDFELYAGPTSVAVHVGIK